MRLLLMLALPAAAFAAEMLTLQQARDLALRTHPRIRESELLADASRQSVVQVRSAFFPALFGSVTTAGTLADSRLAAGGLNNPLMFNKLATGLSFSQLLTDAGRTSSLAKSASFRAGAMSEEVRVTRARVLLDVDRAYFRGLRARAVEEVAKQTVVARQLVADQVAALMEGKLKSELDLSFARVNLSEANLLLLEARNERRAADAELAGAMGLGEGREFELREEPVPGDLPAERTQLIEAALRARPEAVALRLERDAAVQTARADSRLRWPSISAAAGVGVVPVHDERLRNRYLAAGLNINLPALNGGLFSARVAESEARARAAEERLKDLENRIARDVQVAWLSADTAHQRLALTAELLARTKQSLELAQARYDLGLSSIVELSQALLNLTSAELAATAARYEYQTMRSVLSFQTGETR